MADCTTDLTVKLIWAQAYDRTGRPGAIGYQGGMPWHLPEDLKHFASLTTPHPVIMGQTTWNSLPVRFRPLAERANIVLSRQTAFAAQGAQVASSIPDALTAAAKLDIQAWVIGGASLYQQFLPLASVLEVTQIDCRVDADTFAPDLEPLLLSGQWRCSQEGDWLAPAQASAISRYRFLTYSRLG